MNGHIVLFHNSPRNMIIPLDCCIYHLSLAQIPLIVGFRLAMLSKLLCLGKLRATKNQILLSFFVLFTDSALSFSSFFNELVPISSGGKALILASNLSLALKLRDKGEKRRLYQRQWSATVVRLSK